METPRSSGARLGSVIVAVVVSVALLIALLAVTAAPDYQQADAVPLSVRSPGAVPSATPTTKSGTAVPSPPSVTPTPTSSTPDHKVLGVVIATEERILLRSDDPRGRTGRLGDGAPPCLARLCAGTATVAVRPGSTLPQPIFLRGLGPAWNRGPCAAQIDLVVEGTPRPVDDHSCGPVWSPDGDAMAWVRARQPVHDPSRTAHEVVIATVQPSLVAPVTSARDTSASFVGVEGEHVRVIDWVWTDVEGRAGYLVLQSVDSNWVRLWTRGIRLDAGGRYRLDGTSAPFPQPDLVTVDAASSPDSPIFYAVALVRGQRTLRVAGVPGAQPVIDLPRGAVDFIQPELAWVVGNGTDVLVGNGISQAWRVDARTGESQMIVGPRVIDGDLVSAP